MSTLCWRDSADDTVSDWLLVPSYPSIRYYSLLNQLDVPEDEPPARLLGALKWEGQEPVCAWRNRHALSGKLLVDLDRRCRGGLSEWITLFSLMLLKDWHPES
jgi:hypothetical protein